MSLLNGQVENVAGDDEIQKVANHNTRAATSQILSLFCYFPTRAIFLPLVVFNLLIPRPVSSRSVFFLRKCNNLKMI